MAMQKLFTSALVRVQQQLKLSSQPQKTLSVHVQKVIRTQLSTDRPYTALARLPLSDVKTMLKVPCPQPHQLDPEHIAIFKRLRSKFGVEEKPVCAKCQRECPFRSLKFEEMPSKPKTNNKSCLHDICIFLICLQGLRADSISDLRWAAAFKVTSALEILLKDWKILSREALLFSSVFRQLDEEQKQYLQRRQSPAKKEAELVKSRLKQRKIHLPAYPPDDNRENTSDSR